MMYNRFFKRILSMLLVLAMALSFVPTTVFANTQGEEQTVTTPATVEDFVVVDEPTAETTASTEPAEPTDTAEPTEPAESAPAEKSPETKAATATSGTTGSCTWTLDGTVLTISGNGPMADLSYDERCPWGNSITKVIIEEGVTTIGALSFYYCMKLTSLTIPKGVTQIGKEAFYGCSGLTYVIFPNSVTSIGNYAFNKCSSLMVLTIPEGVTSIGTSAFSGCTGLTSVTIPNTVTSIGSNAFSSCSNLKSIIIPDSVTSISDNPFTYCRKLDGIWVDPDNKNYCSDDSGVLFNKDKTVLIQAPAALSGDYSVPDSVTKLGDDAFIACTGLTSVTIPDSVTQIGGRAFMDCDNLSSVIISENLKAIDDYTFSDCFKLKEITIPGSVTDIGDSAFENCTGLVSVTIPGTVKSIGSYAFAGCTGLISVTLQNGIATVSSFAFEGCSKLDSVTIPDSVTSLLGYSFTECTSLSSVTIGSGVTKIYPGTFYKCKSLTSATIPQGTAEIANDAFFGCDSLLTAIIPISVNTIGSAAFSKTALKTVYYGGTPETWEEINKSSTWANGCEYELIYIEDFTIFYTTNTGHIFPVPYTSYMKVEPGSSFNGVNLDIYGFSVEIPDSKMASVAGDGITVMVNYGVTGSFIAYITYRGQRIKTCYYMVENESGGLFAGGHGTKERPFLIEDANDFSNIRQKPDSHYMLINHISLGGMTPIPYFQGTLDGCGYTISGWTATQKSGDSQLGLFRDLREGAEISNLRISDCSISNSNPDVSGALVAGILCGVNSGTVSDVKVTYCSLDVDVGDISKGATSQINAGILCGSNYGVIIRCEAYGIDSYKNTVKAVATADKSHTAQVFAGGLVGYSYGGEITDCQTYYTNIEARAVTKGGKALWWCTGHGTSIVRIGGVVGHSYQTKYTRVLGYSNNNLSCTSNHDGCGCSGEGYSGSIVGYSSNISMSCCYAQSSTSINVVGNSETYNSNKADFGGYTALKQLSGFIDNGWVAVGSGDFSLARISRIEVYIPNSHCEQGRPLNLNGAYITAYMEKASDGLSTEIRSAGSYTAQQIITSGYVITGYNADNNKGQQIMISYGPRECYDFVYVVGHDHQWVTQATCFKGAICGICDMEGAERIPHTYAAETIAPTCEGSGYTLHTCTVCNEIYISDDVAPLGHELDFKGKCVRCGEQFETLRDFTIYVCDGETAAPIAGAMVDFDGIKVFTDATGAAKYQISDNEERVLVVEATGYPKLENKNFIPGEMSSTYIYLDSNDTGIYEAWCNGDNVLLIESQINVRAPSKTATIVVKGRAKTDILKYEIVQDDMVLASATDGVFRIKNPHFLLGKPVYVRMHTDGQDGHNMFQRELNIKVIGFSFDAKLDELIPHLGGASFSFDETAPSFFQGVEFPLLKEMLPDDHTFKIKTDNDKLIVTYGLEKDFLDKDTEDKTTREIYKEILKKFKEQNDPNFWPKGKKKSEFTFTVALIIEVGSDGNIKSAYGEIYIGYEFSHSWGKTFVVWIVPIYVGTKFKVGGNLTLTELGYNFEESKLLIPDAEINLYTELSVYGGIGCSLVSAGVYGTAGGEIIIGWKDLQNYFKYRIYGELGVYARVDPIFWEAIEYKLPLLSGEFYGPNGQARAKRKLLTPENYDVASRDYLETRSAWKTASTYAKRGDTSGVLQTSSYTAIEPRIVKSGDTVMMLFLDDDGSAGYNYQHLYYSILDSATNSWSVPQRVDDSEFADLEYDVYADDSGIYIAYSKIPEITEENREDHLALLAGVEIYTARYDGTAFVEHTNVSDNDYYDAQPQVMHDAVVWVSNNTNDTLGENSNNTLMLAQKTQTGWGAAVALHENGATVTSMDLGQLGGKTCVAVIRDGDCDLSTDDRLLQLVDMTGTVTAVSTPDYTSEGVRFETVDGNCVLQWACAGNVWQLDAAENAPVALFAEENSAINESFKYQQLGEGRGVILFAQNAMDGTSAGSSLYGVYCVDGQWGEVVTITEHAEGMYVDAFDACYYKEKILLAYINTEAQIGEETIDRTCSFISSTVELKNDLAVGEAVFLEAELFEGAEIEIRVPITNGSWQKLQNTRVQVQTENATVVYEQNVALEEAVASGESDRVVFKLPKSCLTAGQAYSVVVTAVDWTDSDLSNNSTSLDLWYADFEVVAKQIVQGEEPQIQYAVINSGNTEGSGRLVVYDDKNEDGSFTGQTPLYEQAITVGISKSVSGIVPALSDLKDNTVYVVVEPTTAEMYLFNNEQSVSVTEAKRTTTDDITGQEQAIPNPVFAEPYVIYDRYDGGEITARATENGWTFTDIAGLDSGSYSYSDAVLRFPESYLQSLEQGYHYYSVRYTLNGKTAEAMLILEVRDQAPLTVQNVTVIYDGAPVEVTDLQYETSSKGAVSFRYNDGTVWHEGLPTDAGEYTVELSLAADAEGFYSAAQKQFILTVNRATRSVSAPQQITRTKEGVYFTGAAADKEPADGKLSYGYSTKADPNTVTSWEDEGFIPAGDREVTYYLYARITGSSNYVDTCSAAHITTGVQKDPVAAVYKNGVQAGRYSNFGEAAEACGTNGYVKLLCDTRVDVTLTKDLYIDLNGFDLSGTLTGGKVYGMDSTTDKYTCEARGIFSCVDASGAKVVPVTHFKSSVTGAIKRYMAVEETGGYSFHRFYLGVTHMSIRPHVTSVGFKAVFYGDEMVVSMLHEKEAYGYSLGLAGYGTASAYKGRDSFRSGQTVTLRVDNYDVTNFGETALTGKVLLKLRDGTVIESSGVTMTLRQLLENLNNDPSQMTAEQLKVVASMIEKFDIIKSWNLNNLTA